MTPQEIASQYQLFFNDYKKTHEAIAEYLAVMPDLLIAPEVLEAKALRKLLQTWASLIISFRQVFAHDPVLPKYADELNAVLRECVSLDFERFVLDDEKLLSKLQKLQKASNDFYVFITAPTIFYLTVTTELKAALDLIVETSKKIQPDLKITFRASLSFRYLCLIARDLFISMYKKGSIELDTQCAVMEQTFSDWHTAKDKVTLAEVASVLNEELPKYIKLCERDALAKQKPTDTLNELATVAFDDFIKKSQQSSSPKERKVDFEGAFNQINKNTK